MQGQFINDKQVLLRAAEEAGIDGAQQLLDSDDELKSEVIIFLLAVNCLEAGLSACSPVCEHLGAKLHCGDRPYRRWYLWCGKPAYDIASLVQEDIALSLYY